MDLEMTEILEHKSALHGHQPVLNAMSGAITRELAANATPASSGVTKVSLVSVKTRIELMPIKQMKAIKPFKQRMRTSTPSSQQCFLTLTKMSLTQKVQ